MSGRWLGRGECPVNWLIHWWSNGVVSEWLVVIGSALLWDSLGSHSSIALAKCCLSLLQTKNKMKGERRKEESEGQGKRSISLLSKCLQCPGLGWSQSQEPGIQCRSTREAGMQLVEPSLLSPTVCIDGKFELEDRARNPIQTLWCSNRGVTVPRLKAHSETFIFHKLPHLWCAVIAAHSSKTLLDRMSNDNK